MTQALPDIESYAALLGKWDTGDDRKNLHLIEEAREKAEYEASLRGRDLVSYRFENTLYITLRDVPECDWQTASKYIKCPKGRAVVEMAPWAAMWGDLYLPDRLAANLRPDVGTVIATGVPELNLGDLVVVRPYDGTWRKDFAVGDWKARGDIRCYGVYIEPGTDGEAWSNPVVYDLFTGGYVEDPTGGTYHHREPGSILIKLDRQLNMTVLKENIIVKRDPVLEQEKGIHLTIDSEFRTNCGTVTHVGAGVDWLKVGQRVVYHPYGPLDMEIPGLDNDSVVMNATAVEMILTAGEEVTGIRTRSRVA